MRNWKWSTVESFENRPDDVLVVLGQDAIPSGELPGGRFAVLRHRILTSLKDQKDGKLTTHDWLEAEGVRALVMAVPNEKPGLDADERVRLAMADAWKAALTRVPGRVVVLVDQLPPERLRVLLEGWWLSSYRYDIWKSKPAAAVPELLLVGRNESATLSQQNLQAASLLLETTDWVRDAVNEPGSQLTPIKLAERMESLSKTSGLRWKARGRKELEKEGYTGLITVGKGSDHEPVLGTMEYRPKNAVADVHLVLVGKGVTFDTGGISLKPGDRMWEMKNDMAGAATVAGAVAAIARLELPVRVTGVVCLAENRPGNNAVLPGDVFRAKNGKTIMVENTDAEGRLILTDGLWEAGALGATHVVDLATLTGAVIRALGSSIAGLFANDDAFADLLRISGLVHGEKLWHLPLEAEYRSKFDDPVADMRNTGGVEAGAITAALFLQEFAPATAQWAHLDIAGTAFCTRSWKFYSEGATAFGVRTLVELARRLGTP